MKGSSQSRQRLRSRSAFSESYCCLGDALKGDIFDGANADRHIGAKLNERIRFVEDQEQLALTHQGKAFRRYLRKRVADTAADETLKKYMAEFINAAPLDEELRWLGRIRRLFAVV